MQKLSERFNLRVSRGQREGPEPSTSMESLHRSLGLGRLCLHHPLGLGQPRAQGQLRRAGLAAGLWALAFLGPLVWLSSSVQ